MTAEARFLSDGVLTALREYFQIDEFLEKSWRSQRTYFRLIGDLRIAFDNAGCTLNDLEMRECVARALSKDRSYRAYLADDRGADATYLHDAERWHSLLLAGAGTILCRYHEEIR